MAEGPRACGLCRAERPVAFASTGGRDYFECPHCRLVQMAPSQRPTPSAERARYESHRNDPSDPGYRGFLARVADPLISRLPAGASGLDFGSGPGPTLSVMLAEAGFPTAIYDPFFAPESSRLERTYDFITCTETAEHFHDPARELDRLDALLRPGGWLAVMTSMRDEERPFETWWYTRDETHVCFYHPETLRWIAQDRGWTLERPHRDVALYHKPAV